MAILIPVPRGNSTPRKDLAEGWTYQRFGNRNPVPILCTLLLLVASGLAATSVSLAAEPLPEAQVKAAFLVNFPKYVEWPAGTFAATNSPLVIAVLGKTEVTAELQKIVAGRSVNGHPIVLKKLASGAETGGFHILFVPAGEPQLAGPLLLKLKDQSVLTVGESADFLERGGVINMTRRGQNIALEINLPAANQARLKISSKLLSVASVVKGKSK